MTIWVIALLCITAAVLLSLLRPTLPSFATALSALAGVLLLSAVIAAVVPLVGRIEALFSGLTVDTTYIHILIKALGICLLTHTAADVCRDAGETALANKAELGGQVLLLICGLPLFEYAASLLESVIRGQAVIP